MKVIIELTDNVALVSAVNEDEINIVFNYDNGELQFEGTFFPVKIEDLKLALRKLTVK